MGSNVYRTVAKGPNVAAVHDPSQNTGISVSQGPAEWAIRETDIPGLYRSAVSLLTFTFNETWLVAGPSDAQTYICAL